MSLGTEGRDGKKRGSRKRGSTNNKRRLDAFTKGTDGTDASWSDCDAKLLQSVVVGITSLGGAVTYGLSRDNGAHSLTLMLDAHRETFWYNRDADLDDALKTVIGTLEQMAD